MSNAPRWVFVPVAIAILALPVAATLHFSLVSRDNREAAAGWREHARRSDQLLVARTHQLNSRSAALDRTAAQLARSERDVKELEARQRQLADEKAQVEDQRGQMVVQTSELAALADEQRSCSTGLSRLLAEFANGDYGAVDADASTVGQACQTAQSDFAAFESKYGTS